MLGFKAQASNTPSVCSATESQPNLDPCCNAIALGFQFQLGCRRDTHIPMIVAHASWLSAWRSENAVFRSSLKRANRTEHVKENERVSQGTAMLRVGRGLVMCSSGKASLGRCDFLLPPRPAPSMWNGGMGRFRRGMWNGGMGAGLGRFRRGSAMVLGRNTSRT